MPNQARIDAAKKAQDEAHAALVKANAELLAALEPTKEELAEAVDMLQDQLLDDNAVEAIEDTVVWDMSLADQIEATREERC